jgi:hypothetical protein
VTRWTIARIRSVPAAPGSDREAVFAIHFAEDDQPEPQMTVEYARGATHHWASVVHARAMAKPYLDLERPPRRIVVDRNGDPIPSDE